MAVRSLWFATLLLVACTTPASPDSDGSAASITPSTTSSSAVAVSSTVAAPTSTPSSVPLATTTSVAPQETRTGMAAPAWLGTRTLELRPGEDNGVAQPTPPELVDRQLWTTSDLAPPIDDTFVSEVTTPPPPDVVVRSTWRDECPVALEDLSYVQVSFVGFDGGFHTGELIVDRNVADRVVEIFASLHDMRFPIEEMRVTTQAAVDAPATGDSNNTSSFVCRAAVNSGRWSRHAHGGAIDINPFHNPYVKGDLVIPELATAYLDRSRDVPGMITPEIEAMFADMGWGWGGNWNSASDWMHFSDTGT